MADTLVGRNVGFNPAVGHINANPMQVPNAFGKVLGTFASEMEILNKKLEVSQDQTIMKGRLDQEAGLTDESRVSRLFRGAYREGVGVQRGLQDAQVLTSRYGNEYEKARLGGASEEELQGLREKHMHSQVAVIDSLEVSEENKDMLRKQVLQSLPTLEKLEAKADARALARQYEDTKVTLAAATRNNILAAAASDPRDVLGYLQTFVDTTVQIERNHGNDKGAYSEANKSMGVYIKALVENVDMENPADVQLLNGLMSADFSQIQGISPETVNEIQGVLYKGRERARGVQFDNLQWNLQNVALEVENGKAFTFEDANRIVAEIQNNPSVRASDKANALGKVVSIMHRQGQISQDAAMLTALDKLQTELGKDVTQMTRREAVARGLEDKWIKARKEGLFEQHGNWSDTGAAMLLTGTKEGSPDLVREGAKTMGEFWSNIVTTNNVDSFLQIEGGAQYQQEFQRYNQIFQQYKSNPAMQQAILQGLPDDIRGVVSDVLRAPNGAQANMQTVIQRYNYLRDNFSPEMVTQAKAHAKNIKAEDLRVTRIFGLGTSKHQKLVGDRNVGALGAISDSVVNEIKDSGQIVPLSPEAYLVEAKSRGFVTETPAGYVVFSKSNRDMINAAMNHGTGDRGKFLNHLLNRDSDYYVDAVSHQGKIIIYDLDKSQSKPVKVLDQNGLAREYQKWNAEQMRPKQTMPGVQGTTSFGAQLAELERTAKHAKTQARREQQAADVYNKQQSAPKPNQAPTTRAYTPSKSQRVARSTNEAALKAATAPRKPAGRITAPIPTTVVREDGSRGAPVNRTKPLTSRPKPDSNSRLAILNSELRNEHNALGSAKLQLDKVRKSGDKAAIKQAALAVQDREQNIKALNREISRM